ncbi:unnamed protein product [Fraxinus pennsylvanica]|uniref:Uncharacterized protein n=1 Tax=Fraxinus pennsylvanica TaxID=56036 RepID=A0AAD1ZF10_9LAMI|nr:unnamed protein product [Fraxinus pennsylvanica]
MLLQMQLASGPSQPRAAVYGDGGFSCSCFALSFSSFDDYLGTKADSFAAIANFYYEKLVQLLALLQDLYNACLSLADSYCRELAKNHHSLRYSSPIPPLSFEGNSQFDGGDACKAIDTDVESTCYSSHLCWELVRSIFDPDMVIAEH